MRSILIIAPYEASLETRIPELFSYGAYDFPSELDLTGGASRVVIAPQSFCAHLEWNKELDRLYSPVLWFIPLPLRIDRIKELGLSEDGQFSDFSYSSAINTIPFRWIVVDTRGDNMSLRRQLSECLTKLY